MSVRFKNASDALQIVMLDEEYVYIYPEQTVVVDSEDHVLSRIRGFEIVPEKKAAADKQSVTTGK